MFWKYYARLLAGIFVVGTVVILIRSRSLLRPVDLLDWVVTLVSLVGLFGYVWKQQIFLRAFWAAFVPIAIVWDLAYELAFHNPALSPGGAARTPELIVVGILMLPLYVALFKYAFGDLSAPKDRTAPASQPT
jgi:hypothetical protein